MPHSDLDATRIQHQLTTHTLGRTLQLHAVTTSTNDDVRHAAVHGAAAGFVVCADHQTRGHGQHGRTWSDTPRAQLMASLLLRPTWLAPAHVTQLINAFVVVLAESITPLVDAPVTLKWPNDVLIAGRKVAGVIGTARLRYQGIDSVCIGWGINVHAHPSHTVDGVDLANHSTAVVHWAPHPVDRTDLLVRQLNAFEPVYDQLQHDPFAYHARWDAAMRPIVGQTRTITTGTHTIHGVVTALNSDGSIEIAGQTIHAGMMQMH